MQALKPADMASLFHVLGLFGFDFSTKPELLQQLLPRAKELLPQMKPFEVTSMYWGLGMSRQVSNSLFRDLTHIVSKLQQQQMHAQERLQQLQGQEQQQPQQGSEAVTGGAAAPTQPKSSQQQRRQEQQPSAKELQQLRARAQQMPESLQRQAFQAYIAARLEDEPVELPPDVLDAFRAAWIAGSKTSSRDASRMRGHGGRALQPLLAELDWVLQQLRIRARIAVRSKLDKLVPVDVELVASGQRLVALQVLDDNEVDDLGTKLAPVQWEEDVLKRNGYEEVHWLRVGDYKRVPKEKRPRFVADVLRKLGITPQERLLAAAEREWVKAGCKPTDSGGGGSGSGGSDSWGDKVGAGGISAAEADVLMQDGGSAGSGGWASGGRGSRSRRGSSLFKRR